MKIVIGVIVILVVIIVIVYAGKKKQAALGNVHFVPAQEFHALLEMNDPSRILLDIRTPQEYAEGHIDGAVNIDFYNAGFKKQLAALDPAKTYLLYCRSGNRTRKAAALMGTMGFNQVVVLDNGINDWTANNLLLTQK
jgi:rhodanese-related sulfurtransferase